MKNTPFISPELITYLDQMFNITIVQSLQNEGELKELQGKLKLAAHLRSLHERQKKSGNILNVQISEGGNT